MRAERAGAAGGRVRRPGAGWIGAWLAGFVLAACGSAYGTAGVAPGGDAGADSGLPSTCAKTETLCADGVDDDCDGLTDCADPDCAGTPACPGKRAKGEACTVDGQCESGHCADGVCCDSACKGGACEVCSVAAGARQDGTCTILPVGTVCRVAAGACDAPEKCDGVSPACPSDALQPPSFVCRPSLGACDTQETCSGTSLACPNNVINCTQAPCSTNIACTGLQLGASCTSAGQCASGYCVDGVCCNDACNNGPCQACSVARGAAANGTCALRAAGAVCRASAGPCDAAESCSGTTATCPKDVPVADGTACGGGKVCSGGACVPPCSGSGCPKLGECPVSVVDTSSAVWGVLGAHADKDDTCTPPAGKTVTYTDFIASLDDGGEIYVNGAKVFEGDYTVCTIKGSGYVPLAPLPAGGASVQIRARNCVTAGVGGNITIRFFGY